MRHTCRFNTVENQEYHLSSTKTVGAWCNLMPTSSTMIGPFRWSNQLPSSALLFWIILVSFYLFLIGVFTSGVFKKYECFGYRRIGLFMTPWGDRLDTKRAPYEHMCIVFLSSLRAQYDLSAMFVRIIYTCLLKSCYIDNFITKKVRTLTIAIHYFTFSCNLIVHIVNVHT